MTVQAAAQPATSTGTSTWWRNTVARWTLAGMLISSVVVFGVVAVTSTVKASSAVAAASFIPHVGLAPELPARGYPIILKTPQLSSTVPRQVRAIDQVGRNIVSGGNFQQIELVDGTVIQQRYFAAWNLDTKQMVCQGNFTFDDEVLTFEPGPTPSLVYVGGRFTKVSGADGVVRTRNRVVLLNLDTCSVDKTFITTGANNKVDELVLTGNRLFVGGDFTTIGGVAVETLAELNATTGAVNPVFTFSTANELTSRVVGLGVDAAGTRLSVAGRFGTITGNGRSINAPTAIIDISNPLAPTLTAHQSTGYGIISKMQEASVAPDGSAFGIVYGAGTLYDYAYLTPTTDGPTSYAWRHFMRDSSFGVAVSNNAMYVTGHFCKPDAGPGITDVMAPKFTFDVCTGTGFTGGVWRSHIAALSLVDGTPLAWNPGQDSLVGGRALTVVTRGLLVGSDGERVNDIRTGASAFFDFGPGVEDTTPPGDVSFTNPIAGGSVNNPASIAGSATDNLRVASYRLAVRHTDGRWIQGDGSLGTAYYQAVLAQRPDGTFAVDLALPAGRYSARAIAIDSAGLRSTNETVLAFTSTGSEGVRPATSLVTPPSPVPTETLLALSGAATDNSALSAVTVRVRDAAGRFVQDDFSLGTATNDLPLAVTAGAFGSVSVGWSVDLGSTLVAGSYAIDVIVTDTAGNTQLVTGSFIVAASPPEISITAPTAHVEFGSGTQLTAAVDDNGAIADIRMQVKNSAGEFLGDDGWFAAVGNDLAATLVGIGTGSGSGSFATPPLSTGTYSLVVIATDGLGNSSTVTSAFTVAPSPVANSAPALVGLADRTTIAGAVDRAQLLGADPDGGAVMFAVDQLPAGIVLDTATGVLSGTPTTAGTTAVTATVFDDEGQSASILFIWTVTAQPLPCVVRTQGADALVDWEPVGGVSTYSVRNGGVWIADVTSPTTAYTHAGGRVTNTYSVRFRQNGATVNVACTPA